MIEDSRLYELREKYGIPDDEPIPPHLLAGENPPVELEVEINVK